MSAVTPLADIAKRMPVIGKLKSGIHDGRRPKAIDTWRLTTSSREYADDFANTYGGTVEPFTNQRSPHKWQVTSEATEVNIVLLGDKGYSIAYELWSGGGCQRRCDGVTAEVIDTTGPDTVEYTPTNCICDRKGELECSLKSRLTFVLPDLPFRGGLVYESGSKNFAEESQGMLEMIQHLQAAGINRGVLRLEQRRSSGNRKFTIATVGMSASLDALASGYGGRQSLGTAPESDRPQLAAGDAPTSPAPAARGPEDPVPSGPHSTGGEGDRRVQPEPPPPPASEGGGVSGEGAPPPDEDIVDAEIVEEHGDPAERSSLIGTFQGIVKGAGLKYDEQVRPFLVTHYGVSLSDLPIDKLRGLVARLNDGSQAEKQEARKRFKVAVQEHAEANA